MRGESYEERSGYVMTIQPQNSTGPLEREREKAGSNASSPACQRLFRLLPATNTQQSGNQSNGQLGLKKIKLKGLIDVFGGITQPY